MDTNSPARAPERRITRGELKAVIRRAAELYAADADADERVSEEDLLRIAADLGLPARHVRQALLELPGTAAGDSLLDRLCGPALTRGVRAVSGDADPLFRRLENYLTTREYLYPLRHQLRRAWFVPAEDTISKIARGFSRPRARYHLARARRTVLAVEPLEPGTAHVRLDVDLTDRRRRIAAAGATVGGLVGAGLGAGLAVVAAPAATDLTGPLAGAAAAVLAFGGTFTTGVSVGLAAARARYRGLVTAARLEVEGLLDRLERNEPLEPPPAPWRRRLLSRIAPGRIASR